ncbi:MAG: LytTR family transcriptional regulator DNA-binding domain-containing protein [Clostridia bacterium]|nr:LytTR family transcriptional regulator DNA-binding domain-containing protein [Clostridia bacterium]
MKITIETDKNIKETEIHIKCSQVDESLKKIIASLSLEDMKFAGYIENETYFVSINDILYFEVVDGAIFFYTDGKTYASPLKLYKIEETVANTHFARISKTTIANLKKMMSIKKAENSRLVATMVSGEKLIVSRQYVSEIKRKLGV